MARAGLGPSWKCLFANDLDIKKGATYAKNWGATELRIADVASVDPSDLPSHVDLVWGSFPCQDLSLAGAGAGLDGGRSGTFIPFWNLIHRLAVEGRGPRSVVLENVCGTLTSNRGRDFAAICEALSRSGYNFGAVVVNAVDFVPQSRPRLFIIAVHADQPISPTLRGHGPVVPWHTGAVVQAHSMLSDAEKAKWIWWRLPQPNARAHGFADLIEDPPTDVQWHTADQTNRLLGMMSKLNLAKVDAARSSGKKTVGTIYRRTRVENTEKVQRAEVRFDNVAGCLRTPAGGSSRQTIMVVDGGTVKSRLLSSREAARLMGLSDDYILPSSYNEAYHLVGDGVAVPVVRYLASTLLEPLLRGAAASAA